MQKGGQLTSLLQLSIRKPHRTSILTTGCGLAALSGPSATAANTRPDLAEAHTPPSQSLGIPSGNTPNTKMEKRFLGTSLSSSPLAHPDIGTRCIHYGTLFSDDNIFTRRVTRTLGLARNSVGEG